MNPAPLPARSGGFSLIELLLAAAVFGIASAAVLSLTGGAWRRERVNAVAIELAAWLEAVRAASQQQGGTGCTITFSTGTLAAGAELARVVPSACAPTSPVSAANANARAFLLPALATTADHYGIALAPATPTTLSFTPRSSASTTVNTDIKIHLAGSNNAAWARSTATGSIRLPAIPWWRCWWAW